MKFVVWDYVYIPEEKQMLDFDGKPRSTRCIRFVSLKKDGLFPYNSENHPSGYKVSLIREYSYIWSVLRHNFREWGVMDGFLFFNEDYSKPYYGAPKFLIENDFDWHKMQLAKPFEHFDAKINVMCDRVKKRADDAVRRIKNAL